jgi:hypothetical protein
MDDIAVIEPPTEMIDAAEVARRQEALRQADAICRIAAQGRNTETDGILAAFTRGETDSDGVIALLKAHYGLG